MLSDFDPLVYKISSISKLFWKEYLSHFEDAQTVVKVGERKIFSFPSFILEVFHRLYYEPEPEKLEPLPPESAWAEKLHDEFSQLIGFDDLVEQCQSNQLAAGLATVDYCRKVFEKLPSPIPQFNNPQQYRDAIRRLKQNPGLRPTLALKDMLNSKPPTLSTTSPFKTRQQRKMEQWLKDLIEESEDDLEELSQLLQREGKQAVQQAQQYATNLEETQVRQMLRTALTASQQKLEESVQWLEMMGLGWGNDSSQDTQVSPTEKIALVQKIAGNDKLRQIAKLAGRFKEIAERKRRSRAKDAFGEITTIELGNDISRLLPSELQKLADPALFPLFAKGYYDRSLLQYKTSGKEQQSRGPIIVCLDSSGSMSGLPDNWAKAVTAVIGQIAYQEERHFRVIHFAKSVQRIDDFPACHHDYHKLLESMLSFYAGGGTEWEPPLKAAIDCIQKQKQFKQADIVIVTDGQCDVGKSFVNQLLNQKDRLGFTLYGVLIGEVGEKQMEKFCDRVWAVKDLMAEDAVIEELFLL